MTNESSSENPFGDWFLEQIADAPAPFQIATDSLSLEAAFLEAGDVGARELPGLYAEAVQQWGGVIAALEREGPDWVGAARCVRAYFVMQMERHAEAVADARAGREAGLNPVGWWYYFEVVPSSLNMLDDLQGALVAAEEAEAYLKAEGLEAFMPGRLIDKVNILKQLAAPLSRDPATAGQARGYAAAGIRAMCNVIALAGGGGLEDELNALANIAARGGVGAAEVAFLGEMPAVQALVEPYFSPEALSTRATSECANLAMRAGSRGRREEAVQWFACALDRAPTASPHQRAFKAFVAYQYGVCMLKMHGLDQVKQFQTVSTSQAEAARKVRDVWKTTITLFESLPAGEATKTASFLPADLRSVVWSIKRDPLMAVLPKVKEQTPASKTSWFGRMLGR